MSSPTRVLVLLTTLAGWASACFEVDAFECGSDDGCQREGTAGRCEPEGVCAYPSGTCDSGWQYSPNAGSIAGTCVAETGGTGESTGASTEGAGSTESATQCFGCQAVSAGDRVFFICPDASTWFEARDACADCGLALASVHSEVENGILAAQTPVPLQLWLGLNDRDIDGEWAWLDDSALDFEPWAEGEPSTLAEDDCAVLVGAGAWSAKRCELPNPYVCAAVP